MLNSLGGKLLHVGRLRPVQVTGPASGNFLLAGRDEEEGGLGRRWPGEVDLQPPILATDPVLEGAVVEEVGGKGRELGVHAVLDFEAERTDAEDDKTLEQRLGEATLKK